MKLIVSSLIPCNPRKYKIYFNEVTVPFSVSAHSKYLATLKMKQIFYIKALLKSKILNFFKWVTFILSVTKLLKILLYIHWFHMEHYYIVGLPIGRILIIIMSDCQLIFTNKVIVHMFVCVCVILFNKICPLLHL